MAEMKKSGVGLSRLSVGDTVQFTHGSDKVKGKVVEDRGGIGFKGRRLYRICVKLGGGYMFIELPAERLKKMSAKPKPPQIKRTLGGTLGELLRKKPKPAKAKKIFG